MLGRRLQAGAAQSRLIVSDAVQQLNSWRPFAVGSAVEVVGRGHIIRLVSEWSAYLERLTTSDLPDEAHSLGHAGDLSLIGRDICWTGETSNQSIKETCTMMTYHSPELTLDDADAKLGHILQDLFQGGSFAQEIIVLHLGRIFFESFSIPQDD